MGDGGVGGFSVCDGCGKGKLACAMARQKGQNARDALIGCYVVGFWRGGASIGKWDSI